MILESQPVLVRAASTFHLWTSRGASRRTHCWWPSTLSRLQTGDPVSLDTGSPSKPTKLSSVQWPRVRGNQVVRDEFNRPEWAEVKQKLEALNQAVDLSQLVASKEEHMMRKILDVFRLLLCANSRMTCYNEMLTALLRCNSRRPCSQFSRCSTVSLL